MHHEPIQQKENPIQQSALEDSGFDSGAGAATPPPAFQLKASNSAGAGPMQLSSLESVAQNAAAQGVNMDKVQLSVDNSPASVGAVATHQEAPGGVSKISVAPDSPTQMAKNAGHELGHAKRLQEGYSPTADSSAGGVGIDSNPAEEKFADDFSAKVS